LQIKFPQFLHTISPLCCALTGHMSMLTDGRRRKWIQSRRMRRSNVDRCAVTCE